MTTNEPMNPQSEARELIEALLEDRITPLQATRLEQLVCQDRDVRRLYLRYTLMHCTLPAYVATAEQESGPGSESEAIESKAMTPGGAPLPGSSAAAKTAQAAERRAITTRPSRSAIRWTPRWAILPLAGGALAAASIALVFHFHNFHKPASVTPTQVAVVVPETWSARLTATAGARWDEEGNDDLQPGVALEPGRVLNLEGGAAEVTFASGARMIVESPASFYVENRNAARLDYGKVAATVPPSAHGFVVTSGQVVVKDLGTEFGLSVGREDGVASVDVFTGKVDVSRKNTGDTVSEPAHLAQGQAVTCPVAGGDIQKAKYGEHPFIRDLSVKNRVPIALHNTGKVKQTGDPDPWWQIVAESADPKFKPQPAVELHAWTKEYLPQKWSDPSRWIATAPNFPNVPAGTYTFRTSVDFAGFDPFSVSLKAKVLVDDAVDDILVNGRSTGVKLPALPASDPLRFRNFRTVELKGPFAAGKNQVDFVVRNLGGHMMLNVQWQSTGIPLVKKSQVSTTKK